MHYIIVLYFNALLRLQSTAKTLLVHSTELPVTSSNHLNGVQLSNSPWLARQPRLPGRKSISASCSALRFSTRSWAPAPRPSTVNPGLTVATPTAAMEQAINVQRFWSRLKIASSLRARRVHWTMQRQPTVPGFQAAGQSNKSPRFRVKVCGGGRGRVRPHIVQRLPCPIVGILTGVINNIRHQFPVSDIITRKSKRCILAKRLDRS